MAYGQASIFAQDSSSAEHQGDRAIESIEIIMNDGGLDEIVPGIRKVSYVNGTHVKGVNGVQSSGAEESGGEALPGYAIALIIVAAVGVIAVALFLIIRKRQKRHSERRSNANHGALAFEELSLDGRSSSTVA